MALSIEGRISKILPIQTGVGSRGEWKKRIFVITTLEQFPREVAFVTWNEKAEALDKLRPGMRVNVQFTLESREFNERWYTDARAYLIKVVEEKEVSQLTQANNTNDTTDESWEDATDEDFTMDNTSEDEEYTELLNDDNELDNDLNSENSEDIFNNEEEDDLPF